MDVLSYSKRCIRKYLDVYHITLKVYEEFESADLLNGKMIMSTKNDPQFGEFEYYFDGRELFIEKICIHQNKHNVPIKVIKIFLLYLLSLYIDSTIYITLVADPYACDSLLGIDKEFCLFCYYQSLGFESDEDIELSSYIDTCLCEMDPRYKKLSSLCLLCRCQEQIKQKPIKIQLGKFSNLKVTMKALLPNLKRALKDAYQEINKYC